MNGGVAAATSPLASFWGGGFEGADHVNGLGEALDLQHLSGHVAHLDEDYRRAAEAGLLSLRESIGWRLAEAPGGGIDLGRAERMATAARRHGVQLLWTLWHYGLPADLSLHDDRLIERFARFAGEVAKRLAPLHEQPPVYTPINEIGFLAWACVQPWMLHAPNHTPADSGEDLLARGYAVKRRLVRAALAAVDAIRAADPRARFMHVEPLCHVVAARDRPDLAADAAAVRSWQWQALDMIGGLAEPSLGGGAGELDLVGINHYHSSQWELPSAAPLAWHLRDPRWMPLASLLDEAWQRYGRPLVIAETGHVGSGRADWLHDVVTEARHARDDRGVPLLGLCLYPLVDRPDWLETARWHESGLWEVDALSKGRRPVEPYLRALGELQRVFPAG